MVSRYSEKNKYGGYTWQIKIDKLFHIYLHETDNESYVVEFKEWRFINFKVRFTFVNNDSIEDAIIEAFDRVNDYFLNHKDYEWLVALGERMLGRVLIEIKKYPQNC